MRVNVFVAQATGLSRRSADFAILQERIKVNGTVAMLGQNINPDDIITMDEKVITHRENPLTIIFNKPTGYVCSRNGQGNKTIYDLLPESLHNLKPVGRLDKDSSGLLLMTNDGQLANKLTHPRYQKEKVYEVMLDKALSQSDRSRIEEGIILDDGLSKLKLVPLEKNSCKWQITMHEGRNRQIRRTFQSIGYRVMNLHRINFGHYTLKGVKTGEWHKIS